MASDDLQALTSTQLQALTTTQVQSLSATNLQALTTTQITSLSASEYEAITSSQLSSLTNSQLTALHGASKTFTSSQTSGLSAAQVTALSITPLVLDLNGNGINTASVANGVNFDLNNDGNVDKAGWVAGGDGLLVRDLNSDGVINNGGELFGEGTVLANGSKAKDGYQALSALDSNLDGVIDAKDAAFGSLAVWADANGNGVNDAGELKSLGALGITSISLNATTSDQVDNGNLIGLMGSFTTADGAVHTMGDVWFSVDASGNRSFDLAAAVQQAGGSKVTLSNTQHDTLNVSLADVLSFGETDIAGIHHVTVDGNAGDTVNLNAAAGWTQAGTVTDGAETYMVYVNANAQLLVNDKINTVIS